MPQPPPEPPGIPIVRLVETGPDFLVWEWNPVEDATGYQVVRAEGSPWLAIEIGQRVRRADLTAPPGDGETRLQWFEDLFRLAWDRLNAT